LNYINLVLSVKIFGIVFKWLWLFYRKVTGYWNDENPLFYGI